MAIEKSKTITLADAKKVSDRLIAYSKIYEKNKDNAREEIEKKHANLFSPQIGRPPIVHTQEKPKTSYSFSKKYWEQFIKYHDGKLTNSKSQKIFQTSKHRRFRQIFDMLNPKDDIINIKYIKIEAIPSNLLELIAPLLEELSEFPEGLSYENFSKAMENLVSILSVDERTKLLNTTRNFSTQNSSFTFKPLLNPTNPHIQGTLVERAHRLLAQKRQKLQQASLEKTQHDLSECTFSPQTTRYKRPQALSGHWPHF